MFQERLCIQIKIVYSSYMLLPIDPSVRATQFSTFFSLNFVITVNYLLFVKVPRRFTLSFVCLVTLSLYFAVTDWLSITAVLTLLLSFSVFLHPCFFPFQAGDGYGEPT